MNLISRWWLICARQTGVRAFGAPIFPAWNSSDRRVLRELPSFGHPTGASSACGSHQAQGPSHQGVRGSWVGGLLWICSAHSPETRSRGRISGPSRCDQGVYRRRFPWLRSGSIAHKADRCSAALTGYRLKTCPIPAARALRQADEVRVGPSGREFPLSSTLRPVV